MHILLVEDDLHLAESLREILVAERHAVDVAQDGELGWNYLFATAYDLILLDVTLPRLDGIRLCQRLREWGYSLPVLMLTARDTSSDKVLGLDAGADVYMVKPFDLQELLAQIRALLRRGSSTATPVLQSGGIALNPVTYDVSYANRLLQLTPKEFALLELFLRNGRRVLSRLVIIEHVWSLSDPPTEETVKGYIKSLRAKLRAAGAPEDCIETVRGVGYRLKLA
jgi:DNA-binding response OmpR family regulator